MLRVTISSNNYDAADAVVRINMMTMFVWLWSHEKNMLVVVSYTIHRSSFSYNRFVNLFAWEKSPWWSFRSYNHADYYDFPLPWGWVHSQEWAPAPSASRMTSSALYSTPETAWLPQEITPAPLRPHTSCLFHLNYVCPLFLSILI